MQLYSRPGWRMMRQVTSDLFVLAWAVGWWQVSHWLGALVDRLAVPAQRTGDAARQMSDEMGVARDRLDGMAVVGDQLAEPFGRLADGLGQITAQSQQQVELVHQLATGTTVVTFLVPVLTLVAWWLPRRLRFIRQATAARRFVDADADLELFALRAMANLPMHELARITDDPVGAWRAGDREVVHRLAALELRRTGLDMPVPVRRQGAVRAGS
ncbi:hypothetical protein GCM10027030_29800 [Luteococcus sediminum]|uniref:hypothetical protein n=1 Tax=Luteococcus sp. TaxID=1969402 RepID=UPI00373706C2